MSDIDEMIEEYNAARSKFVEKGKKILKKSFVDFFEENPEIKAVKWTQYTPYFNDGDECIFGVNDMEFSSDGENFADRYGFDYAAPSGGAVILSDDAKQACKDFSKIINKIPDEVFKDLFGDHQEVTATIDGFQSEDYEHE